MDDFRVPAVASGDRATWPLFGGAGRVFTGPSVGTVVVWSLNWDGAREIFSQTVSAGVVLTQSLFGPGDSALANLQLKLPDPVRIADATVVQAVSVLYAA